MVNLKGYRNNVKKNEVFLNILRIPLYCNKNAFLCRKDSGISSKTMPSGFVLT